jgi:hypothetical protein
MCRGRRARILLHRHIQLEGTVLRGSRAGRRREAGAPLDLKMPLENGRAAERVSKGAGERASSMCVRGGICREGGTPSPAADCRHVPARTPPPPAPRHNGSLCGYQIGNFC